MERVFLQVFSDGAELACPRCSLVLLTKLCCAGYWVWQQQVAAVKADYSEKGDLFDPGEMIEFSTCVSTKIAKDVLVSTLCLNAASRKRYASHLHFHSDWGWFRQIATVFRLTGLGRADVPRVSPVDDVAARKIRLVPLRRRR